MQAGVVKLADARDSKSRGLYRPWGFDSPLRHHRFNELRGSSETGNPAGSGRLSLFCPYRTGSKFSNGFLEVASLTMS